MLLGPAVEVNASQDKLDSQIQKSASGQSTSINLDSPSTGNAFFEHLNCDHLYRRGLEFRMPSCFPSWDRDYCSLFQMTLDGQDISPLLRHSMLKSTLEKLEECDKAGDRPREKLLWLWKAFSLLVSDPVHALEHIDTVNFRCYPSFNIIADCLLYIRAFHYPSWSRELRQKFIFTVRRHLNPGQWEGHYTSGTAALMFIEAAEERRVGRAFHLVRLYNLHIGPSRAESIALYRELLLQGRVRSHRAMVRKVHAALNRYGFDHNEDQYQKELQIRLQTANVMVEYRWWDKEFSKLYRDSLENPPIARRYARNVRHLIYHSLPIRSKDWPFIALRMIQDSPTQALRFLEMSDELPRYPFNMMSDCFLYLRVFHYDNMKESVKRRFRRLVRQCLAPSRWPLSSPSDTGVRLYLQFAASEHVREAFDYVLQHNIRVEFGGMLYFMSLFIQLEDSDSALQVLERITDMFSFEEVDMEKLRGHCCRLIVLATRQSISEEQPWNTAIWSRILDLGITPDQPMLNVVLGASLHHNMRDLAWNALDRMRNERYTPDSYTYVALFEDAQLREDLEQLDYLLGEIGLNLLQEPHIASKVLHVYLKHLFTRDYSRAERTQLLSRMIELYGHAHDFGPLVDLGLLKSNILESADGTKSTPSKHALVMVISAFLKVRLDTADILEVYNRFRQLVYNGHAVFGELAESDYMYNAFLMSLPKSPHLLTASGEIVRQMSEPLPDTARIKTPDGDRPISACLPTVQTWTIFMSHFTVLGDGQNVWNIRELMRQQGLEFNQIAWNTAIRIFATQDMVKDVEIALREMIAAGFRPDTFTMRSIKRLRDRGQVQYICKLLDALLTESVKE